MSARHRSGEHLTHETSTNRKPQPRPEELLRDVYTLRRRVIAGVYAVLTLDLPLYFLFGYSPVQVAVIAIVGWLIAGMTIRLTFAAIVALRKRTSYSALLMVEIGDAASPHSAAGEVLYILEGLLRSESSFIALTGGGPMQLQAARGMTDAEAEEVIAAHADALTPNRRPHELADLDDLRRVCVPIVSLKEVTGVLYLAGPRAASDLGDRHLLEAIGVALGLTLENLRQKEQLLQKEGRLSSVILSAPVVLFSVNNEGVTTFMEGRGMEAVGVSADTVVGNKVWDTYANYPQILQSFRRAFAGDNVTAVTALNIQETQVIFEYRLVPERDDLGRVTGVIGVATDITERKRAEDARRESERTLATLLSNLPGFAFRRRVDETWKLEYISEGVAEALGWTHEDLLSGRATAADIIHPDDEETVRSAMLNAADTGEPYTVEYRIATRSGEEKWLWEQGHPVELDDGVTAIEGFTSDISERKAAEHALADSEERFRDLFENARDAMFTYDFSGVFHSGNSHMLQMTGYSAEEFAARNAGSLVAPEFAQAAAENLKRVFSGDHSPYEIEIVAKDGRHIPIEMTSRIVFDSDGNPEVVQGIARDISERKQAEETIRRLAYHDALTGLPNRALFEDRLDMALAQARRQREQLAVLFMDLDSFKVVNDTLGHSAGDRLLEAVARDLITLVRDGDTVARAGGDEFTILLPAIDGVQDATEVAERVLECLRRPRVVNGREFRTTGSIGITVYPADGPDGETLLRNADTAMYRAKESGRDNYQLYTMAMNQRITERASMERDLRYAVERGELRVLYQPIVDVRSGQVTAAEALARWHHPERGLIMPDEFIPVAEETGLIVGIGEAVLRDACGQMIEWSRQGVHLGRVSVNLSSRQLQQEDMVTRIAGVLAETGVAPRLLELEITEGAVLKNVDYIISMLHQLRQMGVGVALDDFGTGYSSLTYLKRFPIGAVKVDRSFVSDMENDASDATIISTIIAMARSLQLKVIAEGVEAESQLDFLRSRGCDEYQGNFFSEPVTAAQFAALVLTPRQMRKVAPKPAA